MWGWRRSASSRRGWRSSISSWQSRRGLQHVPPPDQHVVHGGGAQDRLGGQGELDRVQDERLSLRTAEPAVERDQLLERAALLELGVVEAAHHDVGHVLEAVAPAQVIGGARGERR